MRKIVRLNLTEMTKTRDAVVTCGCWVVPSKGCAFMFLKRENSREEVICL